MTDIIVLAIVLTTPLILGVFFRVNVAYLFFSVMAGELLGRYFGHDLNNIISSKFNEILAAYSEIMIIILPVLLTSIFLRKSLTKGRTTLHIIPYLVTGVIFAAFVLPLLPPDIQAQVQELWLGDWLLHLNKAIIGAVIITQLITLWLLNRGAVGKNSKSS